ncbi:MAG: amino acid kinase [Candidatus Thiodiazotropha sp.]|nr:amino acid kinase [Candidatus Thiodiazotropha sp. (ex Codakia orbicularis)]PUB76989.1 MAG: amino acid kinase [gamma proteobacterium symbiont of Ctena orbiculata]
MWVVKLGGSLFDSDHLSNWLALLAQAGSTVIVPGGGPFADQVRRAQRRWRFDQSSAHNMALLAMEQFGRMVCGVQPGLRAAASRSQVAEVLARGETPVWLPSAMVMAESAIEHSWEVTSDSLAVWLCGELGIGRLLLVKSAPLQGARIAVAELEESGMIDSQFGAYLRQTPIRAWVLSAGEHGRFPALHQGDASLATEIVTT